MVRVHHKTQGRGDPWPVTVRSTWDGEAMTLSKEAAAWFLREVQEQRAEAVDADREGAEEFYGPVVAYAAGLVKLSGGEVAA